MSLPIILGIESTCDETGVALVQGEQLLGQALASSMADHARFGGIVPEVASRAHLEAFRPTLTAALADAGISLAEVDGIAVAGGPGLVGSLTVGAAAAKALALALAKPLYAVNHVIGHLAVDVLVHGPFPERFIGLVVSGGHTSLFLVDDIATNIVELGCTLDDAAGEAFDKVGRLLGLPYPGGPHVDRLAQAGNPTAIAFPRALMLPKDQAAHAYDFSFSGLKTAVSRWVEQQQDSGEALVTADVAASFAQAVAEVLVSKTFAAANTFGVETIVIGGGFSANTQLRDLAASQAEAHGMNVRIPPVQFCTDNGAMIAALGAKLMAADLPPSGLSWGPKSVLPGTMPYLVPSP